MRRALPLSLLALGCTYDVSALRNDAPVPDRPVALLDRRAGPDPGVSLDIIHTQPPNDTGPPRLPPMGP